jgi:cobalamin biosynthesis protein CbiG
VNLVDDSDDCRIFWVGIGCNSKTEGLLIEMAIEHIFEKYHLLPGAIARATVFDSIAAIATIENKPTVIEFCIARNLPLKTFSSEILQNIIVPHPSRVVAAEVGTPSVAEAAAILACRTKSHSQGENIANLIVPKQIFRAWGLPGVVTIAVAKGKD